MNKIRCLLALFVFLPLLTGIPDLKGGGAEPKDVAGIMKRKLQHSQKILEGIALNDFKEIADHADELIALSKAAEWKVLKTPRYELYSNEFRRNAETLVRMAKDKNLDGAALTYVDLTLTCVKCHKHMREERQTRLDKR